MSGQQEASSAISGLAARIGALFCLTILGGLSAGTERGWGAAAALSALGFLLGGASLTGLGWMLVLFFPSIKRNYGGRSIRSAVSRGFLLLIPFTILALIADLFLGWGAAGTFCAAGIMTACGGLGAELVRLGGNKFFSTLLPMLGGTVFSMLWILAISTVGGLF